MDREYTILKCSEFVDLEKIIKENFFELNNLININQKIIIETKTLLSDIIKESKYEEKLQEFNESKKLKKNINKDVILGFILGLTLSLITIINK